jgi:hypothetical protein
MLTYADEQVLAAGLRLGVGEEEEERRMRGIREEERRMRGIREEEERRMRGNPEPSGNVATRGRERQLDELTQVRMSSIRQHTSAYVSIRQHTAARRAHAGAYSQLRQHTSAYVRIRQHTSAYVSIRQHTSAYVSIRQLTQVRIRSSLRYTLRSLTQAYLKRLLLIP